MKKLFSLFVCVSLLLTLLPLGAVFAASPFADLSGHWAESYVLPLYEKGIISGKSATSFDPEANMTRAEFLTLALKVPAISAAAFTPCFDDVNESQWFAKTVSEAQTRKLIPSEMVENNMFKPDQPITREEMTAVIVRLWEGLRGKLSAANMTFTDLSLFSSWAKDSIAKAVSLGVITGNTDGTFNPLGLATRAEASVIFNRLDEKLAEPVAGVVNGGFHPVYGGTYHDDVDIQKMIDDAYASGAKEVTIPAGVYKIPLKKTSHIDLSGKKNFTINAYDVTLIFDKHYAKGFSIDNTENVTINGLTVDYEEPLFTQAEIIARDPEGYFFDVKVEDGYYFDLSDKLFFTDTMSVIFFHSNRTINRASPHAVAFAPRFIEKLTDNTYRLNSLKLVSASKGLDVGDYLVFLSNNEGYPFAIHGSDGLKMNDVTIYSGCVGISENYGNPNSPSIYRNVRMLPGPTPLGATTPRIFSISGTGFHMTGLRKGFEAYDCYVEGNTDDGVNIHGIYHRAYENGKGNEVIIGSGRSGSEFKTGETLRFYDENYELIDSATIVSSVKVEDYQPKTDLTQDVGVWTFKAIETIKITLDKKVTLKPGAWVENEDEMSNNFILKNCQFINGARGLIVKAGGIIEDCLVQGRPLALRAGPELHWLESGYIHDLTIKNTIFRDCGYDIAQMDRRGPFGAGLFGEKDATTSRNLNITFDGCTFENNYGTQLYLGESKNLTVKNCTFIANENSVTQIFVENSDDVTFSNNTFKGTIPEIKEGSNIKNLKK